VVYCADAFAGLRALRDLEAGTLRSTTAEAAPAPGARPGPKVEALSHDHPVPRPPFLGVRHVTDLDPASLFPLVNEVALFRGRWGFRRGKATAAEYDALMKETVLPRYEALKQRCLADGLLRPAVAYGYFRAEADGDALAIAHEGRTHTLAFPRQGEPPHRCIADYFRPAALGGDVVGLFVVTIGAALGEAAQALYRADRYQDYLLLHGLGVECTDALAELWHERMREELGIGAHRPASMAGYAAQEYQGSRYGFGYPSCPDLGAHGPVFELLRPDAIGVTLTESFEMVPEMTTSALVAHHPQAKYFAV
jgi:5-methyltetrahydrofolate--homocysteine methyltransferase